MKFIDLTGKRFGRLTVKRRATGANIARIKWKCLCDCGYSCIIAGAELKRGDTRSCGCIRKERNNGFKHGMAKTKPYQVWCNMKRRCLDPNNKDYKDYGGRGITIDKKWVNSFEYFWADMGSSYSDDLTLDRVNNDLGYTFENCRWATLVVQANNKREYPKKSGLPECIRKLPSGNYELRLRLGGKHKTIGTYKTVQEAVDTRDSLKKQRKEDSLR